MTTMTNTLTATPLPSTRVAPDRVRLFKYGLNETIKGSFRLELEDAVRCIEAARAHGADLPVDYDHAMLGAARASNPREAGRAAGWFALELGDDGLYARVRWTDEARRDIESGARRYYSPAFLSDPDTGRVQQILNFALTNLPATRAQTPLVAASLSAVDLQVCTMLGLDPESFASSKALHAAANAPPPSVAVLDANATPPVELSATDHDVIALLGIDPVAFAATKRGARG